MASTHVHPTFASIVNALSGPALADPAEAAHIRRLGDVSTLDDRVRSRFAEPARDLLNAGLDLGRLATRLGGGATEIGPRGVSSDLALRSAVVRFEAAQGALFHALLAEAGSDDPEAATTEELLDDLTQVLRANEAGLPDLNADARRSLRAGAGY